MSSNPAAAGRFDGAMSDAKTVDKGFESGGTEAAGEGIREAADGVSQATGGIAGGLGAANVGAGALTINAMHQYKQEVSKMEPGGNKSDNDDKTEDPAFGDAGDKNPPDPTPDLTSGGSDNSSSSNSGGGDSGGDSGGDAGGGDGGE